MIAGCFQIVAQAWKIGYKVHSRIDTGRKISYNDFIKGVSSMLEEKDLQAITQLMAQLLTQQKQEIMQDIEQKMARQKQEILAESTHNMQVLIDAEIRPQFNLLAEQIQTMMETRVDTARVERLEDEVSVHKMMIRQINEDLQQLKKAQ
jgi:hypothetical protein